MDAWLWIACGAGLGLLVAVVVGLALARRVGAVVAGELRTWLDRL